MIDKRLALCAVISIGGHVAFATGLSALPERGGVVVRPRPIEIRVVEPPPPPPRPPEPEPPKPEPVPEPPKQVHERPRPKPLREVARAAKPVDTPPIDNVPTTTETTTQPVYGFRMSSSSSSSGPAVAHGNTSHPSAPRTGALGPVKPLAAPAAAYEVTKMPIPLGRCSGKYTEAAKAAGIEGTVVLDLIVDETGRARDIHVEERLTHGLTEAAVAALQACRFRPGEKNGQPVAVRVRSFKIRFFLQDA
jgi:protein TonB